MIAATVMRENFFIDFIPLSIDIFISDAGRNILSCPILSVNTARQRPK
jgi:hypothetical protein